MAIHGNWRKNPKVNTFSELSYVVAQRCQEIIIQSQPEFEKILKECIEEDIYKIPEKTDKDGKPYYERTGGLKESAKVKVYNRRTRGNYSGANVGIEVYHDESEWESNPEEFEHGSEYYSNDDSREFLDSILINGQQGRLFGYGGGKGKRQYIEKFKEKIMDSDIIVDQLRKNINS